MGGLARRHQTPAGRGWFRLRHRLLAVAAACSVFALAGCAASQAAIESLQVHGLIMQNHTRSYVSAARLLVPATGGFVSCGNIPPGGECATTFPERDWSGNPVEVSWSQNQQIWSTGALSPEPGPEVLEAGRAMVLVVIAAPGSAGVQLLPASPATRTP